MSESWRPRRKTVLRVVAVLIASLVVVLIARQLVSDWSRLDDEALRDALHFQPQWFVVGWIVQTMGWLVMIAAWRSMLGSEGARIPFARHLRAHSLSSLTHVIPGSVWTPMSRIALYRQEGVSTITVSAAVVIEWLLVGLAGLLLYGVSALWSQGTRPGSVWWLVAVAIVAAALLYPPIFGRAMRWAAGKIGQTEPQGTPSARRLMLWFGAEIVVLTLGSCTLYMVMRAVSPAASLPDAMAAFGLAMAIANLLAWLPATSVLREGAFVLVLTPFYGSVVVALAVTVVWRIWVVLVQITWAGAATVLTTRGGNGGDGGEGQAG